MVMGCSLLAFVPGTVSAVAPFAGTSTGRSPQPCCIFWTEFARTAIDENRWRTEKGGHGRCPLFRVSAAKRQTVVSRGTISGFASFEGTRHHSIRASRRPGHRKSRNRHFHAFKLREQGEAGGLGLCKILAQIRQENGLSAEKVTLSSTSVICKSSNSNLLFLEITLGTHPRRDSDKGKPAARLGRKAMGPIGIARPPKVHLMAAFTSRQCRE